MSTSRSVSFKGCTTRAQAIERMGAWLDEYYADQLRTVAAHWLLEDGDIADIPGLLVQLRGEYARNRAECLARVNAALDGERQENN